MFLAYAHHKRSKDLQKLDGHFVFPKWRKENQTIMHGIAVRYGHGRLIPNLMYKK